MIDIYIKELEERDKIEFLNKGINCINKFILKFIKLTNKIIVKDIEDNKKIYLIPNIEKEKIYKKLRRKIEKEKTITQSVEVILSEKMKKYKENFERIKIVEGRKVFANSLEDVLKKIIGANPLELQDVYILANRYEEKNINIIKKTSSKVKSINIITNEVSKYKILEEMMQEQGIVICVMNNKRKSLKKAKIIINLDFLKENINEYSIFRNAMLINLRLEKVTNLKGFEGMIIQNVDIELNEEKNEWIKQNRLENFSKIEIYESLINKKIDKSKAKITKLYGNNGEINEKELRNWQKILTN